MPFHLLIAPDSFKGSLSAKEASQAIARGAEQVARRFSRDVVIDECPISDGGEGFVEAIVASTHGRLEQNVVHGATGEPIAATWGWCGPRTRLAFNESGVRTAARRAASMLLPGPSLPIRLRNRRIAIIECAAAVGLTTVPEAQRNPESLTSFGVGELMMIAMERGADAVIVGLGGSATCDGGAGMAAALGARIECVEESDDTVRAHDDCVPIPIGADLARVRSVSASGLMAHVRVTPVIAACDVVNPLFGPKGAALVYGPQKGATPEQARRLDEGLRHWARKCRDAGLTFDPDAAGAGAAGGMGFALGAFCRAELRSGVELVLQLVRFHQRAAKSDLVITGEGRFDATSMQGKACVGVACAAAKASAPVVALVGAVDDGWQDALLSRGGLFESIETIAPPSMATMDAMSNAAALLERAAARLIERRISRQMD